MADVAIIGQGYVGLPLAQEASKVGVKVLGFDINQGVVDALNSGVSHIDDLSDDDIRAMLDAGFEATTDPSRLDEVKTIVICVPTPLSEDGGPDLGPINSAVKTISEHLQPGQTIILESTTYPGTTDEVVRPALEAGGLVDRQRIHVGTQSDALPAGGSEVADQTGGRQLAGVQARRGQGLEDGVGGALLAPRQLGRVEAAGEGDVVLRVHGQQDGADAAGIGLYGGTMLEGAVGTVISAHAFATFANLQWGTELFGPLLLTEEILREPLDHSDVEGVYAGLPGPHYETPAEIRMLRTIGADLDLSVGVVNVADKAPPLAQSSSRQSRVGDHVGRLCRPDTDRRVRHALRYGPARLPR